MGSECPRCGATKTESVYHGFIYNLCWKTGYHLRRCSACNRKRLFKRDRSRPHPDDVTFAELQESFQRKIAAASGKTPQPSLRFGGIASGQNPQAPAGPGTEPQPSSVGVVIDVGPAEEYHLCPRCGGGVYRRSHRRWYEKLIKRPRMARCMKCQYRFPYPR